MDKWGIMKVKSFGVSLLSKAVVWVPGCVYCICISNLKHVVVLAVVRSCLIKVPRRISESIISGSHFTHMQVQYTWLYFCGGVMTKV